MNVFTVTLIAIAAMLLVGLCTLPYILAIKGRGAWQDIPREVYNRQPQRLFRLRPLWFWIAFIVLKQTGDVFELLKWPVARDVAKAASVATLFVVLVSHLVWAIRIRSDMNADSRLRHFARYALWGSAVGLLVVGATCISAFDRVLHGVMN